MTCQKNTKIKFDISSIEKIFKNPDKVLKDVEGFWKNEAAFQLALGWAPPGYPIHLGGFQEEIEKLAAQTLDEREKNEFYNLKFRAPNIGSWNLSDLIFSTKFLKIRPIKALVERYRG